MEQAVPCSKCELPVLPSFYFCPNCGKSLRPKPQSTSVGRQIGVYALSLLLPPLGLWPAIKYLRDKNPKAKIVGVIAAALTIVSIVGTVYYTMEMFNTISQQLNAQMQMNQLR